MKRFLTLGFACVAAVLMTTACGPWIDPKINIDPNNPADIAPRNGLAAIEVASAYTHGGDLYRYASLFTQQHSGFDRQHLAIYQYSFTESDVNQMWQNFYSGHLKELDIMIGKTSASPHYRGVARVMTAMALGNLSAVMGDIPYSQALQGGANFTPKYDTQEQIYTRVQGLLDSAILDLNATTSALAPAGEDLIYGGNRQRWIRAAWSLKARFALHLSKRNRMQAATQALEFAGKGIQASADDMLLAFGASDDQSNPLYQFDSQRNDMRVNRTFIQLLNRLNDPRRPWLARTRLGDSTQIGTLYGAVNSPVVFISVAETKFIEAEANLILGRADAAKTAFIAGVRGSLTSGGAIIANANPALAGITAPTTAAIDAYVAQESVVPAGELTLARLMEQKYIALYPNGAESFADWRRTGLPALTPISGSAIPRRYPYPQTERDFNTANWQAAGGASTAAYLLTRVWWDVQ